MCNNDSLQFLFLFFLLGATLNLAESYLTRQLPVFLTRLFYIRFKYSPRLLSVV